MEYRKLGRSGLQVSALSLGSWLTFGKQIGDDVAEQLMHATYDAGVNFFDNAEIYARGQSEIVMGNILARSGWDRSSYLVSSKAYFGTEGAKSKPNQRGLSRKHLVEACEAALRRLQVDYLDLYFCHRPDKQTPIEETVWTMHQVVLQGKILYWGTSEWDAFEIMEAMLVAERHHLIAPVMEQPQYNLLTRGKLEREYLHLFRYHGIGTTIWSPLASGVLSGKYLGASDEDTRLKMKGLEWLREQVLREEVMTKVKALKSLAEECETTLPLLSIAWCLKNPHVSTVILGASRLSQLQENLGALDVVPRLTQERMDRIDQIFPKPILPEY